MRECAPGHADEPHEVPVAGPGRRQTDLAYRPAVFPATIPSATSNGNFLRNFGIGVLIGLLIGVIAAYAIAVRRRQFEHAPEPELLYSVPLIVVAVPAFTRTRGCRLGFPF